MSALPYILAYLFPAIAGTIIAVSAWRHRYYRSGRPFTLLMGALAFWCYCRCLAYADPTFEGTLFWALLQFGGVVLIMPAWLLVALSFGDRRWRRSLALLALIFTPAALSYVAALTNSLHMLWWTTVEPDVSRGFMWLRDAPGPLFWAHSLFAYACFVAGMIVLARAVLLAPPVERRQAWLMLAAAVLPALGNLVFLFQFPAPWFDDPTPFFLLAGGLLAYYATVHFRVIDLNPLVEYEALLALPDGLLVLDNLHTVVQINEVAATLLGVQPRLSVGRPLAALLPGSLLGMAMRPVLSGLDRPHTHHVSYKSPEDDHTVEVRSRPLLAANGAVAGAVLLLRDVSTRARAEQSQAQHLAELNLLTRVARVANLAADAEGLVRAVATTIAEAGLWERVAVGLLAPDGTQLSLAADILANGDKTTYEGVAICGPEGMALLELLKAGRTQSIDPAEPAVATTPLGKALAAEGLGRLLVVPLFHQGVPLGLLALGNCTGGPVSPALSRVAETIGELITDAVVRARLYDEVRQADQLKASFLASVSHELRTPLTSIIGYLEMLQKGIYGQPAKRMEEPLAFMRLSSMVLLRMINDILDFSRAEAGHLRVDLVPVDVLHAVANVVGQLQPQIRERGLDFELEIPPGLPLVRANQARLEQVVTNLLSNAVKFTEAGLVTVRAVQVGDRVRLSVSDTGMGIAPEHQKLIFQEFRRVEGLGRRSGGTGLGLAISRRLVELMGGSISVESTVGEGSTFTVDLGVCERLEERNGAQALAGCEHSA